MLDKDNLAFYSEWISTFILIVGVTLTAYNIYPLNVYVSILGNAGWLFVSYLWKKWSLGFVQLIITAIYVSGLLKI